MRGEFPWRLKPAEVWRLMKDGFSVGEVSHICGVSEVVALGMMAEAERAAIRPAKRETLRRAA